MRTDTKQLVDDFLEFIKSELEVSDIPEIEFVDSDWSQENHSFGQWDGNTIKVVLKGRHPMDVLRTLAHEVVHQVKNHTDGSDGSDDENEANALAGKFMRKFGKSEKANFGLKAESRMLLEMFGSPGAPAEGFETPNQGQTRQAGQHGPESTADAQEMIATDRPNSVNVVWSPGEYGADTNRVLKSMHKFDPLFKKLKDAGPYAQIQLEPAEAQELGAVLNNFLQSRVYSKPDVQFCEDVLEQLQQGRIHEKFAWGEPAFAQDADGPHTDRKKGHEGDIEGWGGGPAMNETFSGKVQDGQGFDVASMERRPAEPDLSDFPDDQFTRQKQDGYTIKPTKRGFFELTTPDGNVQVFSDEGKAIEYRDWHKGLRAGLKEMFDIEKESKKEKQEHPWASKKTAEKIAKDHARKEGKLESVFVFKKRLT